MKRWASYWDHLSVRTELRHLRGRLTQGPPRTGSLTVGVSVWFCFISLPVSLFDLWIACCIELFHCWMKLKFGIVCRECTQFSRQTLGGLCRGYRTDLKKKNKELEKNMLIHRQNGGLQFTQIIENGRSVLKSPESLFHTFW